MKQKKQIDRKELNMLTGWPFRVSTKIKSIGCKKLVIFL